MFFWAFDNSDNMGNKDSIRYLQHNGIEIIPYLFFEERIRKELMTKNDSRYQKFYYQQLGMEEKEKIIPG